MSSSDQPAPPKDALKRALEQTRFERAREIAESMANHRALLTTSELARINRTLVGAKDDKNPWRTEATIVALPGGRTTQLDLIADPVLNCREKLHRATEQAEAGNPIDAAVTIYTGMVLSHFFADGNRRTAALAAHYFLKRYGIPLSGWVLHELGLGDLRQPGQIEALRETLQKLAELTASSEKSK
jgi:Fic family protein